MSEHCYCIIVAGGVGSRFWPISREAKPKQFLDFTASGQTFLKSTFDRMATVVPKENIIVVSLVKYRDLVLETLPDLPEENLLLEPYSRNTAPAITFATYHLLERDPDAVMVVTPADHIITDLIQFEDIIEKAFCYASSHEALITLGIVPTRPDTNFGYIQMADSSRSKTNDSPVKIKTFTEKPDADLAEVFVESGEFLWNSGIFIWKASTIRNELEKYSPDITNLWKEENVTLEKIYSESPKISIDYAVMEKSSIGYVYPASFGWADIGNWQSLYEHFIKANGDDNVVHLGPNQILKNNSSSIFYCSGKNKLVAIKGLEDYLVVDTRDVLMICPRDDRQIKELLSELAMPAFEDYR